MRNGRAAVRTRACAPALRISKGALDRLVRICTDALPGKAFGMLIGPEPGLAREIRPMQRNLRQISALVNSVFESYGDFYRNRDRGFCFDPGELAELEESVRRRNWRIVGVYHSHRCRHPEPSQVDIDFHYSPEALAVIVSVVNPEAPEVKAFRIRDGAFSRARLLVLPG